MYETLRCYVCYSPYSYTVLVFPVLNTRINKIYKFLTTNTVYRCLFRHLQFIRSTIYKTYNFKRPILFVLFVLTVYLFYNLAVFVRLLRIRFPRSCQHSQQSVETISFYFIRFLRHQFRTQTRFSLPSSHHPLILININTRQYTSCTQSGASSAEVHINVVHHVGCARQAKLFLNNPPGFIAGTNRNGQWETSYDLRFLERSKNTFSGRYLVRSSPE